MYPVTKIDRAQTVLYGHFVPYLGTYLGNQKMPNQASKETIEQGFNWFEQGHGPQISELESGEFEQYKAEFKAFAPFLPKDYHAYHAQVYLYMCIIKPDYSRRFNEMVRLFVSLGQIENYKAVRSYFQRALFNIPAEMIVPRGQAVWYEMFLDAAAYNQGPTPEAHDIRIKMYGAEVWEVLCAEAKEREELLTSELMQEKYGDLKDVARSILYGLSCFQIQRILAVPASHVKEVKGLFLLTANKVDGIRDNGEKISVASQWVFALLGQINNLRKTGHRISQLQFFQAIGAGNSWQNFIEGIHYNAAVAAANISAFQGDSITEVRRCIKLSIAHYQGDGASLNEETRAYILAQKEEKTTALIESALQGEAYEGTKYNDVLISANHQIARILSDKDIADLQADLDQQKAHSKKQSRKPRKKRGQQPARPSPSPDLAPVRGTPALQVGTGTVDKLVVWSFCTYAKDQLIETLAAFENLLKKYGEDPISVGGLAQIYTDTAAMKKEIGTFRGQEHWSEVALRSISDKYDALMARYRALTVTLNKWYYARTAQSRNQQKYNAHFKRFKQAVCIHLAEASLFEARNYGGILSMPPSLDMASDIYQYFHCRALPEIRRVQTSKGSRQLLPNEMLGCYVTNRQGTENRWFCISVHRWVLKDVPDMTAYNRSSTYLDEKVWSDQDKHLGNAWYVLHIPYP